MWYGGRAIAQSDAEILRDICLWLNVQTVLEFWPWQSTLEFANCCQSVDTLEDKEEFMEWHRELFAWKDNIKLQLWDTKTAELSPSYDMVFIDWPRGTEELSRWCSIEIWISLSDLILIHDDKRIGEEQSRNKLISLWWNYLPINTEAWIALLYKWRYENIDWSTII